MVRRIALFGLGLTLLMITGAFHETPLPSEGFPNRNGLWIGHQWYTGRNVRTGAPVPEAERRALVRRLREHRIRYAFVHVGPLRADGSISDHAGPEFRALLREAPRCSSCPGSVRTWESSPWNLPPGAALSSSLSSAS